MKKMMIKRIIKEETHNFFKLNENDNVIFEGYNEINEIKKLSELIFSEIINNQNNIDNIMAIYEDNYKDVIGYEDFEQISYELRQKNPYKHKDKLASNSVCTTELNKINENQFQIIDGFIKEYPLVIYIELINEDKDSAGYFLSKKRLSHLDKSIIAINLSFLELAELMKIIHESLKKVKKYNKNENSYIRNNIKSFFMKEDFFITLQHELQHAYDDYVSDGKNKENKKQSAYRKNIKKNIDTLEQYVNLPNEIWARFTETVLKVYQHPYLASKKDFNEIWNEFKENYDFFEKIRSEKTIKRLQKALYKYHDEFGKNP